MSGKPSDVYHARPSGSIMGRMPDYSGRQPPSGRILFIDAYDSFSNNIVAMLKEVTHCEVSVITMDLDLEGESLEAAWEAWTSTGVLDIFDAIVCGPGPGTPDCDDDVGIFKFVWDLDPPIPVLGICLGFQCLVKQFGGEIRKLKRGLHGMVRNIELNRQSFDITDLNQGVPPFSATLYHSLCADIGQDDIPDELWNVSRWKPTEKCPLLVPQAWTTEIAEDGTQERILMAVKHVVRPYWGLQYHPESVCSDPATRKVLKNWYKEACRWNSFARKKTLEAKAVSSTSDGVQPRAMSHLAKVLTSEFDSEGGSVIDTPQESESGTEDERTTAESGPTLPKPALDDYLHNYDYVCEEISLPQGFGVADIVDVLGLSEEDIVVLDSSSSVNGDPLANYSIVACDVPQSLQFRYQAPNTYYTVRYPSWYTSNPSETRDLPRNSNIWEELSSFWYPRYRKDLPEKPIPFRGGFMGYISYEMGLYSLCESSLPGKRSHSRPDICFSWVSRSIVLDHRAGVAYIQALVNDGPDPERAADWPKSVVEDLMGSTRWQKPMMQLRKTVSPNPRSTIYVKTPDPQIYEEKVSACKVNIANGESYELCLTSQTTMTRPRHQDGSPDTTPWEMFKVLRQRQPAPFGSFIRLGGATLLSSSPERFLSHDKDGLCTMRPMKGTVRKSAEMSTLAQAEKVLHTPKEQAENLMIVDLVRHDLHGACGDGKVVVSELMKVEEYASVFTMVSVVKGQLPFMGYFTGLDALSAALPPGSMTGAPKKRSCEILRHLEEDQERSLYSGVVGFMDITGNGDWSVTIRSMFSWDDGVSNPAETEGQVLETWRIGAGGAVTILSTPEGERDEMFTKLAGPLGVFRDVA